MGSTKQYFFEEMVNQPQRFVTSFYFQCPSCGFPSQVEVDAPEFNFAAEKSRDLGGEGDLEFQCPRCLTNFEAMIWSHPGGCDIQIKGNNHLEFQGDPPYYNPPDLDGLENNWEEKETPEIELASIDLNSLSRDRITAIWVHVDKLNRLNRQTLPEWERHLRQEKEVIARRAALAGLMQDVLAGLGGNMAETTKQTLTKITALLDDCVDFDPYAIHLRMRAVPAIIKAFEVESSDAALIENLRTIYAEWTELHPLFNEVNRPFTLSPQELEGMVTAYAALRDWICDAPDDKCDQRIKSAITELVQGLKEIDQSSLVRDRIELSEHDAILIGGALDTLPVIMQALAILKQRADGGEANEWQNQFSGAGLVQIKTTLDWARRIDWAGVRGHEIFKILMRLLFGSDSS